MSLAYLFTILLLSMQFPQATLWLFLGAIALLWLLGAKASATDERALADPGSNVRFCPECGKRRELPGAKFCPDCAHPYPDHHPAP
jgi:hypothetical protein